MKKFNHVLLRRTLVTIGLFILYKLGLHFSFAPTFDQGSSFLPQLLGSTNYSLFALGFMPAITGYFLVEIVFLVIPKFRNIRNSGQNGRQMINRWSIGVSLLIAILQAWLTTRALSVSTEYAGATLIQNPTMVNFLSHSLFFVVGFALILLLGKLISEHGIGNGFCLMIGLSTLEEMYRNIAYYVQFINTNNIKPNYIGFIVLICLLFLIFNLLRKKDWTISASTKNLNIPFFLQGAVVLTIADGLMLLPETFRNFGIDVPNLPGYGAWSHSLIFAALTSLSSFLGYWMFSGKKRISSNLSIDSSSVSLSNKSFIQSTVMLSLLSFVFTMPFPFWDRMFIPYLASLFSLMTLIAVGLDIWNQCSLILKKGELIEVCELDNVYLASALHQSLEESQIPHTFQGMHFRRLFFFFEPFIKMKLLVPCDDKSKALSVLGSLTIKNI